jgi:hypothetical protein
MANRHSEYRPALKSSAIRSRKTVIEHHKGAVRRDDSVPAREALRNP